MKTPSRQTAEKKPKPTKRLSRQEEEEGETYQRDRKREREQEDEEDDEGEKEEGEARGPMVSEEEREEMLAALQMFHERGLDLFDSRGKRERRKEEREKQGEREDDLRVYQNITEYLLKKKKKNGAATSLQKSRGKDLIHVLR